MSILLDTNAYSALVKGHRAVTWNVRRSDRVWVPAVVVGELLYGFRQGRRYHENAARLESFLDRPNVTLALAGYTTADRYGLVSSVLHRKGHPIPTNDMWVAAHALETGADLISADAHFELVEGLSLLRFSPDSEDSVRERVYRQYAPGPQS